VSLMLHSGANAVSYDGLRSIITPQGTDSHVPVPHHEVVELVRYTQYRSAPLAGHRSISTRFQASCRLLLRRLLLSSQRTVPTAF
jgi:hypothetical protein